jgi:hypothetical protein
MISPLYEGLSKYEFHSGPLQRSTNFIRNGIAHEAALARLESAWV